MSRDEQAAKLVAAPRHALVRALTLDCLMGDLR